MKIALPTSSKRLLVAMLLSVCTFLVAGEAAALCSVTLVPTGVTSRPGGIDYRGSIVSNSGCACVNNDTGSFASSNSSDLNRWFSILLAAKLSGGKVTIWAGNCVANWYVGSGLEGYGAEASP